MAADEPGGALRHKSVGQLYFSENARDSPPMVWVGTPIGRHGSLLVHAELVAGAAFVERASTTPSSTSTSRTRGSDGLTEP
jgi:hypothetical protein